MSCGSRRTMRETMRHRGRQAPTFLSAPSLAAQQGPQRGSRPWPGSVCPAPASPAPSLWPDRYQALPLPHHSVSDRHPLGLSPCRCRHQHLRRLPSLEPARATEGLSTSLRFGSRCAGMLVAALSAGIIPRWHQSRGCARPHSTTILKVWGLDHPCPDP